MTVKFPRGMFVTGTDTGVGKTWATLALMEACKQSGLRVAGMKPVATGATVSADGWRNEDAVLLGRQCSVPLPYDLINPYCLELPVSPHIAAKHAGVEVELEQLVAAFTALTGHADMVIVEGVGGWYTPLSDSARVVELAARFALPVVLVVGMRLGCLNHALLSAQAIQQSGVPLLGWLASPVEQGMLCYEENLATLRRGIEAPCLGVLPHLQSCVPRQLAQALQLSWLQQ